MEEFLKKFKEVYSSNEKNLEIALLSLRKLGASQMDALKVVRTELNLNIKEADKLILNSKAWADKLDQTIDLRNSFADFLENENE